ncbi:MULTISPECIES: PadR family transcriptional regulator [Bacillaceae]|uniref:PadR family transcriptional regulator n=1 Tax=Bacillaceae TaxID=186817 RepID=UPI001BDE7CAB|nr:MULTISPECIES: PadR family transcriptional regulator [Bacillaceae]MDX8363232.1 PadR family transcriptional regulator [Cytobacillus sp. IB215316]
MSVKHILLGVLSWYPSSGYGIKKEVEYKGRELGWGKISYGSIYPKLKELENEKLIYCYETQEDGRTTKVYDLTKKGWDELQVWLSATPSYPVVRDELMMKMSFWKDDSGQLINHLEMRKKESLHMLDHFKQWENNEVSLITGIAALSMDYVKLQLKTEIEWIDQAIYRLRNNELSQTKDPYQLTEKAYERQKKSK